jgi:hypothetical protein
MTIGESSGTNYKNIATITSLCLPNLENFLGIQHEAQFKNEHYVHADEIQKRQEIQKCFYSMTTLQPQ